MKTLRYIDGITTIRIDQEKCIGCGMCETVCPHQVFYVADKKAILADKDGCMECGACAVNCPVSALTVNPGVGCASLIISRWLNRKNIKAGGCC